MASDGLFTRRLHIEIANSSPFTREEFQKLLSTVKIYENFFYYIFEQTEKIQKLILSAHPDI